MAEQFEKPKGFKKKLENFWYHYKGVVLLVAFLLFSVIYLGADVMRKQDPDMTTVYVSDVYGSETQFRRVEPAVAEIVTDLNGDGRVRLNYRMLIVKKKDVSKLDMDYMQAFNYSFLDKDTRLYFLEERFAKEKEDYFVPLDDVLPPQLLEKGIKNKEGRVYAVPMEGSAVAEEMNLARPGMYMAVKRIMDTEKQHAYLETQQEKAKRTVKYILEGDK